MARWEYDQPRSIPRVASIFEDVTAVDDSARLIVYLLADFQDLEEDLLMSSFHF